MRSRPITITFNQYIYDTHPSINQSTTFDLKVYFDPILPMLFILWELFSLLLQPVEATLHMQRRRGESFNDPLSKWPRL